MPTLSHTWLFGAVVVALCLLLSPRFRKQRDPRQPPAVPATIPIPFVGHFLGMLIYRNHYYTKISNQWDLPIISLPMFGRNVYVVKSPELIYSIQRQPKSLSFWYFEAHFSAKLGGLSQAATEQIFRGLRPESTDHSVVIESLKGMKVALSPQGDLNRIVGESTKVMAAAVHDISQKHGTTLDLESFVRHEFMMGTTDAIYGALNPYRDPKVESGFWDFVDSTMYLALPGILPKLFAPKAVAGRDTVVTAIHQYYRSKGHCTASASQLTQTRYNLARPFMDELDIAGAELTNGLAVITNSVPTAFWVVFHVFSDPTVLSRVRDEVEPFVTTEKSTVKGFEARTLHTNKLKDAHFIQALIQETLRFRARGTGPRMVLEDVTLSAGEADYHIEKDSMVIIAHEGMHYNKAVWGENADKFVADRFLAGNKIPGNAFRGFGGGANMCPGKGFATAQIVTLIAMLAVTLDMKPASGQWEEPGQDQSNVARENTPPLKKVLVEIVPRRGMEHVKWTFSTEA